MIELTMILVCLATFDYKHAPFKAFRVFVSTRCPVRRQGCHARSGLPYRCASGHVFFAAGASTGSESSDCQPELLFDLP